MRPILMKGHERPLTFLRYNQEADLLFSYTKDHTPNVWFADNGERLGTYRGHNGVVWCCDVSPKYVDFSIGDKLVVVTTDPFMGLPSTIQVKRIARDPNEHGSHFLTGSSDKSAKLWDARTLTLLKTYVTERPVNACAISPLLDHVKATKHARNVELKVAIGGGQEALHVTTTDRRAGKFEAKFFHKNLQEEIGGVKGHFGPINALAFNPDGRSLQISSTPELKLMKCGSSGLNAC
ncbi:hypothetical protein ZIOFF_060282 [Zingiber officinale]|uniref:Serine-threonine kinase receptor-associated protein n=1 Tax=Zingiber officinale TaxID=94328 RepID=A0A8J5KC10_ZINOF|nr:hypothetical protein ZIOFF_060282 [Zingiber officinale]